MKSQKVKKIILVILSLVLAIIWWDNLKLFYPTEPEFQNPPEIQNIAPEKKELTNREWAFKLPRVNPFNKSDFDQIKSASQEMNQALAKVQFEKPSSRHRLLGVLKDKMRPQAVINSSEGSTAVLSLSDSLINWVLVRVDTNLIVFQNDKMYDTLWLETNTSREKNLQ